MSLRSRRKLLIGAVAVVAAGALTLSGCSAGSSGKNNSKGTTSVTVFDGRVGNFTENFNPLNNTGSYLSPTNGVLYEPLFYYNKARAEKPVPLLGTSFKWNDDGTELTVGIRQGVKWSNGKPESADDVVYSLNLVSNNPGLNTSGIKWTAKKVDDKTVVIDFPSTSFTLEPQVLGNEPIVPQSIWKNISDPTKTTNTKPVGTGPYMLKSYTPQSYVLEKNPYYWGTGDTAPKVDQVRYISLANADAATSALESGQVDYMGGFLPTLKDIVAKHKNLSYSNSPQATTAIFTCANASMGCEGPQTDPAVRQAMYYAMDRTQLNTQALKGFGLSASPTLILNTVNKSQITSPDYMTVPQKADADKAKSILKDAGWSLGSNGYFTKDGKELDLSINVVSGWTDYDTVCTLLKGQFKEAGINLSVNQTAQNSWTQAEISGKYQLSLNSINMGVSSNPYFQYSSYLASSATAKVGGSATTNVSRFSDPAVDAAINTLATTNDESAQQAAYKTIQDTIVKQMPYIPIYVNQALAEYNNSRATGWPSQDNQYAFPLPWGGNWGVGIVLKSARPVK
ncbi:ABC transporter substrate-binding protein [Microbacterium sp. STN6]|uniref:ABC transporter substrate-binding protein n=1 Tax=Microbacterium sp. STN6 TaxID=2995588 RepID=UPI002260D744|nr:ABC transporter substrate-binding protein [Microbacterium sp. STN6]MCX7522486.1 ABC transporter substrate-binding protein [Microbacterium sp. STN6]